MSTVERIVSALREKPLTRPELSKHIVDVTPRTLLYHLNHLEKHGFVEKRKVGNQRHYRYHLVKKDGLLIRCQCCQQERPSWVVDNGLCRYCSNVQGTGEANKKRTSPLAKEDACSIAYQRLLRGQKIGITNS
ncbi:ArsR/SmtB family transcription factor [Photobacterium atrarenae]|uniref:Winged helix-turn-helix domain-containing protein n=1 Tax=Photobacterium atrarenae TaxID=865757 RepID=A0ABY5GN43_9GAMM|nr:winged helix-turn-helix domain-containing protein [Photobacterium atrarenae]UTV30191.1 winged helix-turn-helix domain-containing protein [Photobacterium atrarenae]